MKDSIKSLKDTPFYWVDDQETMDKALEVMRAELKECPVLAVDLEYAHGDTSK